MGTCGLGEREGAGACSRGLAWGAGGAQLGWALRWQQDGSRWIARGGGGRECRESGKWSFLARIEMEGRVPEPLFPPRLEVRALPGGGMAEAVHSGENAVILHWPGQSEGVWKPGQA